MKDRVIRVALAFLVLASTVNAEPSSAATATGPCTTALASNALSSDQLPPAEMITPAEISRRAAEIRDELARICATQPKANCEPEAKARAAWKVALNTAYSWTLRPVLTRVAPVGLLAGAILSVIVALNMIDNNFSKESVATVSAVFGLLTSQIVNGMMAPALTPITSKFTQWCWRVARWAKGQSQTSYATNPEELDELYAKSQDLVRLTAQSARSIWFEHASLAEDRHQEAAQKWLSNVPNRDFVVPNIIAMSLRRLTKRFPELNLLGDLEIEREFRFMFRNQFTMTALKPGERQHFAAQVVAALERAELEIEEEPLAKPVRDYYIRVLDVLIIHPEGSCARAGQCEPAPVTPPSA